MSPGFTPLARPTSLGTKIEAFRGLGHDDYFGSHDLEDFIVVIAPVSGGNDHIIQLSSGRSPEASGRFGQKIVPHFQLS